MDSIIDTFSDQLHPRWSAAEINGGRLLTRTGLLTFINPPVTDRYVNAQITDYNYQSFQFRWRPPLRLVVRAWAAAAAGELLGTAGFGFWNHPFSPDVEHVHRRLRLPQAIWFFFGSPPNDMQLAHGVPGAGWKAAQVDAGRAQALALIPLALPAVLLMQHPTLYDRLYPPIQRALAIGESLLPTALLLEPHTYRIDWRLDGATFAVDERVVLETQTVPRGPVGFVAWIDNQYAIATPRGRFGVGIIPLQGEQRLLMESIHIEPL